MLIYNTTFHADDDCVAGLKKYLCSQYVPIAVSGGYLKNPKVCKVLKFDDEKGESICVQFSVKDLDALNKWLEREGHALLQIVVQQFGKGVTGFSTLLEEIEWEKL